MMRKPTAAGATVATCVALLAGCERRDAAPHAPTDGTPAIPEAAGPTPPADLTPAAIAIGPDGIDAARVGMTVAEIRRSLAPDLRLGELDDQFMVDLNGIPVVRGQDTLYHLVFPAGEDAADDSVPLMAATDHADAQTAEGIGPGSTLAEAAATYGSPTLRYSTNDEMREYASFPGYPHERVRFRVAPGDSTLLAGRYEREGEYTETTEYDGDARLMMVFVDLRSY